jgi:DNA-binding CsgD family transcriptional regulator
MTNIKNHPSLLYAEDLKEICKPLQNLGITYFAHVIIDEKNKFSALGMQPDFVKIYYEKKYYNFDIHRSQISQQANYIFWDMMQREPEMEKLYDDFNSFSLGHSFTIVHHIDGCQHCFHFSADLANESINNTYLQNLDFLKKFILYFKEKVNMHRGLKKAHEIKSNMQVKEESSWNNNIDLSIDRVYLSHDKYLTLREFQCLHWLTSGKTMEEISIHLSISLRTMKAHIEQIKKKLNCSNLFQLGMIYQIMRANQGMIKNYSNSMDW